VDTGPTFSIDELAVAAGLPTRTVRHYQSEGALPPPRREGRAALYDTTHLERLRLIGRLQDRGLRLDAIRDALRQVERGHLSLEAWLGLGEQVRAAWSDDSPALLADPELEEQFGYLQPGLFAALMRFDLIRRPDASAAGTGRSGSPRTYLVPSPRLLRIVLALREAGIDVETSTGALEFLRKQQRRTADDFVSYLLRRTGKGFARKGTPQDVANAVAALRAHTVQAAELLFAQEMERAVRAAFDQGQPRFARSDDQPSASATQQAHQTGRRLQDGRGE
jgi:DNA-binding transcriptional MerR regulator